MPEINGARELGVPPICDNTDFYFFIFFPLRAVSTNVPMVLETHTRKKLKMGTFS
jgi:hypothetical protein